MKGLADISGRNVLQTSGFAAETGADQANAQIFGGLAQASRRLRQQLQPLLDQQAEAQAVEDVADAAEARENGRTAPNVPMKWALTRQSQVYNQVMQAGVTATARADYADELTRLKEAHPFDPDGFEKEAAEFIKGYTNGLSNRDIDLATKMSLELAAKETFGREQARIAEGARVAQVRETQDSLQRRLKQVNAEVATLLERDGLSAVAGEEYGGLEQEFTDIVDILVDNPVYGWSAEAGAEAVDSLMNAGTEIVAAQGLEATYHKEGVASALTYIDGAVNGMVLDTQERIGARSRLQQRLGILQQMTAIEKAENKAKNDALIDQMEGTAASFEAQVLGRMGKGEKPTQSDLSLMQQFVTSGAMKPARMNVYVNAATSKEPTSSDQATLASLFDYARTDGVTREQIEWQSLVAISNSNLKNSDREAILRAHEGNNDDRLKPADQLIDGLFATSMNDFRNIQERRTNAAEAKQAVRDWMENNPDATGSQIRAQAKSIARSFSRDLPPPALPIITGFSHPRMIMPNNVDQWSVDAMLAAFEAFETDPDALNNAMRQIEDYQTYVDEQFQALQDPANASE